MGACSQTSTPARQGSAIDASQDASALAQPQPELPICANCSGHVKNYGDPDELHMTIEEEYVGSLVDVELLISDGVEIESHVLDSGVVSDLNDPATTTTIVELDFMAGAKEGWLVFGFGPGEDDVTEAIPVE